MSIAKNRGKPVDFYGNCGGQGSYLRSNNQTKTQNPSVYWVKMYAVCARPFLLLPLLKIGPGDEASIVCKTLYQDNNYYYTI